MIGDRKVYGIIPARSGSKGLPDKNIKELHGKPMLAWSIEAAEKSQYLDRIVLTTDSKAYGEVGKKFGAEVPFIRPDHLSDDEATSFDVVEHCLKGMGVHEEEDSYLVLLEPTSPLRIASDIDRALERLEKSGKESIVGICEEESRHPNFLVTMGDDGTLVNYLKDGDSSSRRQDLESLYFFEGTVYISTIGAYLREKTFYHASTLGYVVPRWKSVEVDDLHDFITVEAFMNHHRSDYGL